MDPTSQSNISHKRESSPDSTKNTTTPGMSPYIRDTRSDYPSWLLALPNNRANLVETGTEPFNPYLISCRKRALDIGIASTVLVVLCPLLLTVGLIIRLSSPGPALFRQARTGAGGRAFTIYKFRSMKLHQQAPATVVQAQRGDDRITSFGHFIRRTSIDELPQILNVLNGTMSLVGPRPHAAEHDAYYTKRISRYAHRFTVLPGLSGLAQVNGARGATPRLADMERRLAYDLEYIQTASLRTDLRILAATVREMLLSSSAY